MGNLYGGAGSLPSSAPTDAPGNAPSRAELDPKSINTDALGGIMEAAQADPKSLQMALLGPLRDQLEQFESDGSFDDDPHVKMLSQTVQTLVGEQLRRLDAWAAKEDDSFYDAIDACRPARDSMIDDERQWRAMPRVRDSKAFSSDAPDRYVQDDQRIASHTTRARTTMFAARLGDMIFPTNDFPVRAVAPENPDPAEYPGFKAAQAKLVQAATNDAQQQFQQAQQAFQAQSQQPPDPSQPPPQPPQQPPPVQPDDVLTIKDYADQGAAKAQAWLFNQFERMHLRRKGREALHLGAKLGCGLWYGPFPEPSKRRVPRPVQADDGSTDVQLDMQIEETIVPGLEVRDPFRFFYDLTPSLEESNACYYLNLWTERQMAEFKAYPNVITTNVDKLLADDAPDVDSRLIDTINKRAEQSGMKESIKNRWPVIEVDRVMKPDDLEDILGITWDGNDLPLVKGWICNKKCLKFKLSPLERDWRPPYYSFGLLPKDDTIFWYSVPAMGRSGQKGIDGALNATIFNAAAAAAPMIIVNKGQVAPTQERWRLNGMVVFNNLNPDMPAGNAMQSFSIQSNVEGNLQMLDRMTQLFDDDTLFEQILSGNISGEDIAASQLAQLVNLASVYQRQLAGYVDDYLMGPFAERCIWWLNIYGDDIDAKGPHIVQPIAASQLVAKDILIQHVNAYNQTCDTPDFRGFSDSYKRFRLSTALLNVPDIMDTVYDRDKAMENQQQINQNNVSPESVRMADVQRQAAKDKLDNQLAMAKLQQEGQLGLMDQRTQLQIATIRERTALVQLMTQKQVDLTAVSADLQKTTADNDTQKQIATLDKTIEAHLAVMAMTKPEPSDPHSRFD
jgi:hypothetical protein